jgi:hypothetical protein
MSLFGDEKLQKSVVKHIATFQPVVRFIATNQNIDQVTASMCQVGDTLQNQILMGDAGMDLYYYIDHSSALGLIGIIGELYATMAYYSACNFVHGDLHSRNVMVSILPGNDAKITRKADCRTQPC